MPVVDVALSEYQAHHRFFRSGPAASAFKDTAEKSSSRKRASADDVGDATTSGAQR